MGKKSTLAVVFILVCLWSFAVSAKEPRLVYDHGRYCLTGETGPEQIVGGELLVRTPLENCLYGEPGLSERNVRRLMKDPGKEIKVQNHGTSVSTAKDRPFVQSVSVGYTSAMVVNGTIVLSPWHERTKTFNGFTIIFCFAAFVSGLTIWSIRYFERIERHAAAIGTIAVLSTFLFFVFRYWGTSLRVDWVEQEASITGAGQMLVAFVAFALTYLAVRVIYFLINYYLDFIPTERLTTTLAVMVATYLFWIGRGEFGRELSETMPAETFIPVLAAAYLTGAWIGWNFLAPKALPRYLADRQYLLVPKRFA